MSIRKRFSALLGKFWWIIILVVVPIYFFVDIPILEYILLVIGIPIAILILSPFVAMLISPLVALIGGLFEHFKESKGMPFGKRFIFMPLSLFGVISFVLIQIILSIWVLVISFFVWENLIGTAFTIITFLFLGLAPLGIISAPFIVLWKEGFLAFADFGILILMAVLWPLLSKLAWTEDYLDTPEEFLDYSPQTYILGALALQMVSLVLYKLELPIIANWLSNLGGWVFLLLALISSIKWYLLRRKLAVANRQALYRPSIWVYIIGFITVNILDMAYQEFQDAAPILFWLSLYFIVVIMWRLITAVVRRLRRG